MPSFPELDEPLTGSAVALRVVAERDIPEILIAHQDDPRLHVELGLERPPSGAELGRRIEQGPAEREGGTALWLALVHPGEDECVGAIDIHQVDWDHLRAELGIWVAPQHRRRGLGSEALRMAAEWLLAVAGLCRVGLTTEPGNQAMRAAAAAAGFSEEGRLRGYVRERGRRLDVVVCSLIAEDLQP